MILLIINFIFSIIFNKNFIFAIEFDYNCQGNNYYDSLNYECIRCDGKKNLNLCYSIYRTRSIYTFDEIYYNGICSNDEDFTELDGNRKLLLEPKCVKKDFDYSDMDNIFSDKSFMLDNNNIEADRTTVFISNNDEFDYYYKSCIDGNYERACDFAANLCVLSLYDRTKNYCRIISDLDKKLSGILDVKEKYIYFDDMSILNKNIDKGIGFDDGSKDSPYITKLDLYLAKWSFNGTFMGMNPISNELILCSQTYDDSVDYRKFGNIISHECEIDLNLFGKDNYTTYFYQMYLKKGDNDFQIIPVDITNKNDRIQNQAKFVNIFRYIPESLHTGNIYEINKFMNNHLKEKIEQVTMQSKILVKEKSLKERFFEFPPSIDLTSRKVKELVFYKDPGRNFEDVLFIGMELEWLIFVIYIFNMWCIALEKYGQSLPISIFMTYVMERIFWKIRIFFGEKNVAKKAVVDNRFL